MRTIGYARDAANLLFVDSLLALGFARFDVTISKHQKCRPVGTGGMSAAMLTKRQFSRDDARFNFREIRGSQVFLAQQFVNRPRCDCRLKTATLVNPLPLRPRP